MKNFFPVILTAIFITLGFFSFSVFAFEIPELYIIDFKTSKAAYVAGEEIKGSLIIENREDFWISDLNLRFELYLERSSGNPLLIDRYSQNHFCLEPFEKNQQDFDYWLPDNLPAGKYFLRSSLVNSKGWEINFADKDIKVSGDGKILIAALKKINGGTDNLNPSLIEPGEVKTISLDLQDPYSIYATSTLIIALEAKTYDRFGELVGKTEREQKISKKNTLASVFELALPLIENPGQYRTELRFINKGNADIISNLIDLAWIVLGEQGNAEISYVMSDRDYFTPEKEAVLKINFFAFSGFEKNDKINISAVFQDDNGNTAGTGSIEAYYDGTAAELKIRTQKEIDNPKIILELSKNGEVLDRYEFKTRLKQYKKETGIIPENETVFDTENPYQALLILLIGMLSVASALGLYFLLRKKPEAFAKLNLKLKKLSKLSKKAKRSK